MRRVDCRSCAQVKRERLSFLADNTHYTERFAYYVGRRCAAATIRDVAEELHLDWHAVKDLEKQYMRAQLGKVGHARSQGNRHRRDLDPQGTHLPHCGERPDSRAPDLVRRRGSLREEHGDVLRRAGREEDQGHSPGGDGHVEAVSQRDQRTRPAGGDSLRQVPHHASSGQSPRRGAQERVPADSAAGTAATSRARSTRCSRAGRT